MDKASVLEQFVPVGDIDPTFYAGRSLYLVADGVAAQHPYRVLAEAMQETGQAALGRVVLSSQRQLVLVRPCGRMLGEGPHDDLVLAVAVAAWMSEHLREFWIRC